MARAAAGRVVLGQGAQTKKISTRREGDVVAIGKLDPVAAGDLLHRQRQSRSIKVRCKKRFPVYQLAIATKDRKDDVRLSGALQKLVEEDAGLEVVHDQTTHEIVLQGQGEPHLRSVLERLKGALRRGCFHGAAFDAVQGDHPQERRRSAGGTRSRPAVTASSAIASSR